MGHFARRAIVTDGLVFQLDPNNSLGQYKNIANPTEVVSPINGLSIVDGAYVFDGVDNRMDFVKDQFIVGDIDYSFEFWFSYDSGHGSGQANLFYYGKSTVNYHPKALFIYLSTFGGKVGMTIHNEVDDNSGVVGAASSIAANIPEFISGGASGTFEDTFHHYVAVFDSVNNLILFYLDGALLHSVAATNGFSPSVGAFGDGIMRIGSGANGSTGNNEGKLGLFNIYQNKALDATEVLKNYEAQKHRYL